MEKRKKLEMEKKNQRYFLKAVQKQKTKKQEKFNI